MANEAHKGTPHPDAKEEWLWYPVATFKDKKKPVILYVYGSADQAKHHKKMSNLAQRVFSKNRKHGFEKALCATIMRLPGPVEVAQHSK